MTPERQRTLAFRRMTEHTFPPGATVQPDSVHFRVWAPDYREVSVVLEGSADRMTFPLAPEKDGYFSASIAEAAIGTLYRYQLGNDGTLYPDPSSRFQPSGPNGPSQVIDPYRFQWSDADWRGIPPDAHVIYEMHIGTFTPEGTWSAAERELARLKDLGVTTLEIMPIADFPGRFGWGYDGVNLFAPTHLYGMPDDVRRFVNRAHAQGLAVILDVVYNHLGPEYNYLKKFAADYFSTRYVSEWGETLNFDDKNSGPVREFFLYNAAYWIEEFHFDGLRIDATPNIFDTSPKHIIAEIVERVEEAAKGRRIFIVAENEAQNARIVSNPQHDGYGVTATTNDDFHHSAMVAMTGRREAYYTDYLGRPQEFISLAKYGHLYQGQFYQWQKKRRGNDAGELARHQFVNYLENHDQVANSGLGHRVCQQTSPGRCRALTALLLLLPQTPMLFQGQEFGSSKPFFYFADHNPELAQKVTEGREAFLAQFPSLATEEMRTLLPDPADPQTFMRSKLDLNERYLNGKSYALHKDLLQLRRENKVFTHARHIDGAVLGSEAFVLRFFDARRGDRLLLVNLGRDLHMVPIPEPLLAPYDGMRWSIQWSSESPEYGGGGTVRPGTLHDWTLPGHAAIVMRLQPREAEDE